MTRVLVTGASGFIGPAALAKLLACGFEVHALGRRDPRVASVTYHALDLLTDDPAPLLARVVPTHLLHLAWYAEPGKFWTAPQNLDWVSASLRLARAFAVVGGIRLVAAGSCAEYAWTGDGVLRERETPLDPATLYGTAKAALFRLLLAAAPVLGLSFAWGRVFFPYGPHEQPGRLLSSILDGIAAARSVDLSEGHQRRDFIHAEDAGAALAALLVSPVEGPVNIASGVAVTVRDFATRASDLLGGGHLLRHGARPMQPGEPPLLVATVDRLDREVGFHARFDLGRGLAHAVANRT